MKTTVQIWYYWHVAEVKSGGEHTQEDCGGKGEGKLRVELVTPSFSD